MSRYFYHFRTAAGALLPDPVGSEHEDDDAAVLEAALSGAELMRGETSSVQEGAYEIRTGNGQLVEMVPIRRH